ncbi:MAG: stress responsive alpha-beta barrel [Alphaproteobacteria bacterium]|nr:stress responsive alpha-beta barrel [Alphaproteobacteria bacterium]
MRLLFPSPSSSSSRVRRGALALVALAAPALLGGCALGVAAGAATVGVAGAVVGTTAKVAVKTTGAVIDAATPGDDKDEKKQKDE